VIAPKWLAWHLFMVASVFGMLALGNWQLHRAESGNPLSWAYTFEWPFFAIMAVVFWAKTLKDEAHPPAPVPDAERQVQLPATVGQPGAEAAGDGAAGPGLPGAGQVMSEEDEELAAYNSYLARLQREVRGHGKWHGLR